MNTTSLLPGFSPVPVLGLQGPLLPAVPPHKQSLQEARAPWRGLGHAMGTCPWAFPRAGGSWLELHGVGSWLQAAEVCMGGGGTSIREESNTATTTTHQASKLMAVVGRVMEKTGKVREDLAGRGESRKGAENWPNPLERQQVLPGKRMKATHTCKVPSPEAVSKGRCQSRLCPGQLPGAVSPGSTFKAPLQHFLLYLFLSFHFMLQSACGFLVLNSMMIVQIMILLFFMANVL